MRERLILSDYAVVWRGHWPAYGGCPATGERHEMEPVGKSMWGCRDCDGWFDSEDIPTVMEAGRLGSLYHGQQN